MIRFFLNNLTPIDIELLLYVLKITGGRLVKEDPDAMNQIINLVNEKIETDEKFKKYGKRVQFMLETITELDDIRNVRTDQMKSVFDQTDRILDNINKYLKKCDIHEISSLIVPFEEAISLENEPWWDKVRIDDFGEHIMAESSHLQNV